MTGRECLWEVMGHDERMSVRVTLEDRIESERGDRGMISYEVMIQFSRYVQMQCSPLERSISSTLTRRHRTQFPPQWEQVRVSNKS